MKPRPTPMAKFRNPTGCSPCVTSSFCRLCRQVHLERGRTAGFHALGVSRGAAARRDSERGRSTLGAGRRVQWPDSGTAMLPLPPGATGHPARVQPGRRVPLRPRNRAGTALCNRPGRPDAVRYMSVHSRNQPDLPGRHGTPSRKSNSPRSRESPGHGPFSLVVAGARFELA